MTETVKARLQQGKTVMAYNAGPLGHHKIIEFLGMRGDYHAIWLEQEHVPTPHHQLEILSLACRAHGLDSFVRLPVTDYAAVMRPLEAGVGGILAAQIRNVDQVRQVATWCKYPPLGQRGMYGSNVESRFNAIEPAELITAANEGHWLGIQIETAEAVDGVREIAAVPGVDHLFIGPRDLSVSLGVPGDSLHPKCLEAISKVATAAQQAGISWGVLPSSREHADHCRELGCQMFVCGSDFDLIGRGLRQLNHEYEGYFEG